MRGIYRAEQCSDVSDCDLAIYEIKYLQKTYGHSPILTKRLISLEHKREQLTEKKLRGGYASPTHHSPEDIRTSSRYVEVATHLINVDESRFQNREHLNEKKLKYIQDN